MWKDVVTIEWTRMNGLPNKAFLHQLEDQVDKDKALFLICRAGARSNAAAAVAVEAGYTRFSISPTDLKVTSTRGQRKSISGGVFGLPWSQD